jgi:ABC-type transport system involved in multi-copper enzyme maturation permease subunit
MNKYQVVWLIIRLAGVYFAYLTLAAFLGLAGSIPALFTLPKIDVDKKNANANVAVNGNPTYRVQPISPNVNYNSSETSDANAAKSGDSITAKFKGENVTNFLWFLILTAFYGAAAWYLLRDGRILYGILNREEPHGLKTKEKEAEVTSLNLSDKQS